MVSSGYDQEANLTKADRFCREAKERGADIALFPEMWNVGYCLCDPDDEAAVAEFVDLAVDRQSPYIAHFEKLAEELEIAVAATYLEKWTGHPRNSVSLIDRNGEMIMTYAKVHTCDFSKEISLTPGEGFEVCDLDIGDDTVKIGTMICYDREFPESARILMLGGAEIILVPNACEVDMNRIAQFRTRAFENMLGVAMANYAEPDQNGHSVAFHPMVYDEEENSRDTLIIEAGGREGVYLAEFNLEEMREYRAREVWGNAFRRPGCYHDLISTDVRELFVRASARR
jgi:predicted amidohydrolase